MATVSTMSTHALAGRGIRTTLLITGNPDTDTRQVLLEKFGLAPLKNYQVRLMERKLGPFKATFRFYWQAVRLILLAAREEEAVVMTRNTTFLPYLAFLRGFGIRTFFETHSYHGGCDLPGLTPRPKQKWMGLSMQYGWMERIFLNRCSGLIAITKQQLELYRKDFLNIPAIVLPLGVPVQPVADKDLPKRKNKTLVYAGRMTPYTDFRVIFEGLALCKDKDIRFLWIGLQDAERERMEQEAARNGVQHRAAIKGWMDHQTLRQTIMENASVGIAVYYDSFYTSYLVSPTKVFDYFGMGLPVIATDIPTLSDILGNEGLRYKPGDAASFAEAVENLLRDETDYQSFQKHALEAAVDKSWDNRAARLLDFIQADRKTAGPEPFPS